MSSEATNAEESNPMVQKGTRSVIFYQSCVIRPREHKLENASKNI